MFDFGWLPVSKDIDLRSEIYIAPHLIMQSVLLYCSSHNSAAVVNRTRLANLESCPVFKSQEGFKQYTGVYTFWVGT